CSCVLRSVLSDAGSCYICALSLHDALPICAVPASKPVKIDGSLDEWDLSGRIWSFADIAIRDRFSVETAAMWDKDYLYLAFHFRDRKSTRLNSSHVKSSYAVFCLNKKTQHW